MEHPRLISLHAPGLAVPGPSVLSGAWIHTVEEIPARGGQKQGFAEPLSHLAFILLRQNRSGESHSAEREPKVRAVDSMVPREPSPSQ